MQLGRGAATSLREHGKGVPPHLMVLYRFGIELSHRPTVKTLKQKGIRRKAARGHPSIQEGHGAEQAGRCTCNVEDLAEPELVGLPRLHKYGCMRLEKSNVPNTNRRQATVPTHGYPHKQGKGGNHTTNHAPVVPQLHSTKKKGELDGLLPVLRVGADTSLSTPTYQMD